MNKQSYKKYKIQQYYRNKRKQTIVSHKYLLRRHDDVIYKIIDNLSRRARYYLRKSNIQLKITHLQLIGCSSKTLKIYLQNKFVDGMNYDNYGKWDIDHIKAISLYDLSDINELKECFNYKNLQPMWHIDNIKKSNKPIEINTTS